MASRGLAPLENSMYVKAVCPGCSAERDLVPLWGYPECVEIAHPLNPHRDNPGEDEPYQLRRKRYLFCPECHEAVAVLSREEVKILRREYRKIREEEPGKMYSQYLALGQAYRGLMPLDPITIGVTARKLFRKAIRSMPTEPMGYIGLADYYYLSYLGTTGEKWGMKRAIAKYDEALKRTFDDALRVQVLEMRAKALETLGRNEEARECRNQSVMLSGTYVEGGEEGPEQNPGHDHRTSEPAR